MEVLFILFVLFISVNGLQKSKLILKIAQKIEQGSYIPLKLVITTFFLSMFVTNDIALIVMVPLTLALNINKKDILVILEALSANSGSALTPIGNPQNLFIYWFYNIPLDSFIKTIAPFSLIFLVLLVLSSLFIKTKTNIVEKEIKKVDKKAYIYGVLLIVVLLTVLHILPILSGLVVVTFAILFDRKSLKIDYALLLSFLFFFGIADNLETILKLFLNEDAKHIFLYSALSSQIISNVPATLLFVNLTSNWKDLLWGTNVGGFGSLFGSLANLIAYRIYITSKHNQNTKKFTLKFFIFGYISFVVSLVIYFVTMNYSS